MPRQVYLPTFLSVGLFLTFLTYRGWGRSDKAKAAGKPDHPNVLDWVLALLSLVPAVYIVSDWQAFFRRAVVPTDLDLIIGIGLVLLCLEAARRTVGILVPIVVVFFMVTAYFGSSLPRPFTTSDFGVPRLIGHNVMGTQGIFGTPLDVAATYIILFTIYGAVLAASGATRFFIDLSFAAFGQSPAGPGPDGHPLRIPPRHRVRLGSRDHRHPRWHRLAAAEEGRLPGRARRRCAGGCRHRRDPVTTDAGRGRVPHRRAPPGLLPARCSSGRRSRRSCTTSGSSWRSRWTPAGTGPTRSSWRPSPPGDCCSASATTSAR